jgi:hypothetical protein
MEHIPFLEVNTRLANQGVILILWDPKVYYHAHKNLLRVPLLIQTNPVYIFPLQFFIIHFTNFDSI